MDTWQRKKHSIEGQIERGARQGLAPEDSFVTKYDYHKNDKSQRYNWSVPDTEMVFVDALEEHDLIEQFAHSDKI